MLDEIADSTATDERVQAWYRLGHVLIETWLRHAPEVGPGHGILRHQLGQLANELTGDPEPVQVLIAAGTVAELLEGYLRQTQRVFETLTERRLPRVPDPSTGLPGRETAEEYIRQVCGSDPGNRFLCVFYVHRMTVINATCGEKTGNEVLRFCSQNLAHILQPEDQFFRWSGPVLVAVLKRSGPLDGVLEEIRSLLSVPLSRFFETPKRLVFLPMKISGHAIRAQGAWKTVVDVINQFAASAAQASD